MKTNDLAVRPIISLRESEKMVWTFIRHGNHSNREAMKNSPKHQIEEWFLEGNQPIHRIIARCRNFFTSAMPLVENFRPSTSYFFAEGGGEITVSMFKGGNTQPEKVVMGSSGSIGVDYEAKFESACSALTRAIEGASFEDFHTSIIKGISSIESYINHRAEIWNNSIASALNPLIDSKEKKVSFEDKITKWLPIMAGGKKLDKSGKMWNDFLTLQKIRDENAIHSKNYAQGGSYIELALALNKFKTGIADFLLQLHIIFDESIPSSIIRAKYYPEVYLQSKGK